MQIELGYKRVLRRIACAGANLLFGAYLGFFGAALVWGMIYGVGSSVIQDWEYAEYGRAVAFSGAVVGGLLGFLSGLVSDWAFVLLPVSYFIALVLFLFFSISPVFGSWQSGLTTFYTSLVIILTVSIITVEIKRKAAK